MAVVDINWHPTARELRIFAGLQWLFCGIVAWYAWKTHAAPGVAAILCGVSSGVALLGLLAPRAIRPVYVGWMLAVFPIGWVVSHVVLAAVFFLVITPIGATLRLLGHDPLHRRYDRAANTYWIARRDPPDADRYFRQF
jgi:hypothetical protein